MPGILTVSATMIVAITGLITVLFGTGILRDNNPSPTLPPPLTQASPSPTTTAAKSASTVQPTTVPKTKSTLTSSDSADCFGIPQDRVWSLLAPQASQYFVEKTKAEDGPIELNFSYGRELVGGIKLSIIPFGNDTRFEVESLVDSSCNPIKEFMPVASNTKEMILNWDNLCFRVRGADYSLFLAWEDNPQALAAFDRLSPDTEATEIHPSWSDCQDAFSRISGSD